MVGIEPQAVGVCEGVAERVVIGRRGQLEKEHEKESEETHIGRANLHVVLDRRSKYAKELEIRKVDTMCVGGRALYDSLRVKFF